MALGRCAIATIRGIAIVACLAASPAPDEIDHIVAKHLEAVGGAAKLRALRSLRLTGVMTLTSAAQTIDAPFVLEMSRPNKARMEARLGGSTMIQAFNGTIAWRVSPGKGAPEISSPEETKEQAIQAEFDEWLLDYRSRGVVIEHLGTELRESRKAIKLKLAFMGKQVYSYLDAESFLEIGRDHLDREGNAVDRGYIREYRDVGGLKFPALMETDKGTPPVRQILRIDSVAVNVEIPEARFDLPRSGVTPSP